ncbi:Phage P22-like portal protein [uncultured Caudovirales phage]|uniref:Phage P22-like portal protein n=5 Tax=uncultured Caudovirales phage TaxID=2100421 RepID=A0A6J5S4W1_9CAUD|nr:Phage P22-like portal protein [uncultured Caudovirales phage]CAB5207108.1 Phage P22-like portal protein [uncultured Caudovirales phage]
MSKDVAKRYQDNLARIKKVVRNTHDYFKDNYDRYNEFRKFVFESSLTEDEITLLMTMNRPQLEFNVLEAYISRLLGEFSKQEPDIEVNAFDEQNADSTTIKVVEQHLKHVFMDSDNEHLRYEVYKDLLSGGFSVVKVYTEYEHPMSMNQVIKFSKCEPTLSGFDKIARYSHKGDGNFCFELFPRDKDEFLEENPDVKVNTLSFRRDFAGFNWSYQNDNSKIIVLCDYYEKRRKEETIVQVRDGRVMTQTAYRKMVDNWNELTVPPSTVGKPRKTMLDKIVRYRLIENQVLEYEETDFAFLPLVFIDGNSMMVKTPLNGNIRQVTRPYVYHAKGAQRLKNYAGISLANEIENTVQHKFMVAKEALPKEENFLDAYKDVQKESVLVYNSVHESNPEMPINNPIREVQRVPAPPEIAQAFTGSDSLIQNVLGSYDASLGINNNQLSGIAIVEGASQSNATAMPYIVGCLQGFQRLAQIYVDLMPKYMVTPRTLPILDEEGRRHFVKINQEQGMPMDFDTNVLNVAVKAGASFQVQKSRTIMMVKEIMGMSPLFSQFMAEKGLNFILDNMDGKGIEELKALTGEWVQQYQQEKAQAQQAQQQNPAAMKAQIDMAKMQQAQQKNQMDFQLDMAKLQQDQQKVIADLHLGRESANVQLVKALTERFAKQVDLHMKHADMKHRHMKEAVETHHKVRESHDGHRRSTH